MVVPESAGYEHNLVVEVFNFVAIYLGDDIQPFNAADGVLDEHPDA